MDNILEELWYGNVSPWEQCNRNDREAKELIALLHRNREQLAEGLTQGQREMLEEYEDCQSELSAKTERTAFIKGFGLGVRLLSAAMHTQTGE